MMAKLVQKTREKEKLVTGSGGGQLKESGLSPEEIGEDTQHNEFKEAKNTYLENVTAGSDIVLSFPNDTQTDQPLNPSSELSVESFLFKNEKRVIETIYNQKVHGTNFHYNQIRKVSPVHQICLSKNGKYLAFSCGNILSLYNFSTNIETNQCPTQFPNRNGAGMEASEILTCALHLEERAEQPSNLYIGYTTIDKKVNLCNVEGSITNKEWSFESEDPTFSLILGVFKNEKAKQQIYALGAGHKGVHLFSFDPAKDLDGKKGKLQCQWSISVHNFNLPAVEPDTSSYIHQQRTNFMAFSMPTNDNDFENHLLAIGFSKPKGLLLFQTNKFLVLKDIDPKWANNYRLSEEQAKDEGYVVTPALFTIESKVCCVSFDAAARFMAWGGESSGYLCLWEIGTEAVRKYPVGFQIYTCNFSFDSLNLCYAGSTKTLFVQNLQSGRVIHRFKDYDGAVLSTSFTPQGTWLASSSECGSVILRQLMNYVESDEGCTCNRHTIDQSEFKFPSGQFVEDCAIASSNGDAIISFSDNHNHSIYVYKNFSGKRLLKIVEGPKILEGREWRGGVGICAHGLNFATSGPAERSLKLLKFDPTNKQDPFSEFMDITFGTTFRELYRIKFSNDMANLLCDDSRKVYLVQIPSRQSERWNSIGIRLEKEMNFTINCTCFCPIMMEESPTIMLAVGFGTFVQIFERRQSELAELFLCDHDDSCLCCEFCFDGSRLVTGSRDNHIRVWETKDFWKSGWLLLCVKDSGPVALCAYYLGDNSRTLFASFSKRERSIVTLWEIMEEVETSDFHAQKVWVGEFGEEDVVSIGFISYCGFHQRSESTHSCEDICLTIVTRSCIHSVNLLSVLNLGPSFGCLLSSCKIGDLDYISRTLEKYPHLAYCFQKIQAQSIFGDSKLSFGDSKLSVLDYCIWNDLDHSLQCILEKFPHAALLAQTPDHESDAFRRSTGWQKWLCSKNIEAQSANNDLGTPRTYQVVGPIKSAIDHGNQFLVQKLLKAAFRDEVKCYEREKLFQFIEPLFQHYSGVLSGALKSLKLQRADCKAFNALEQPKTTIYRFNKSWSAEGVWGDLENKKDIQSFSPEFHEKLKKYYHFAVLMRIRSFALKIVSCFSKTTAFVNSKPGQEKFKVYSYIVPLPFTGDIGYRELLQKCVGSFCENSVDIFHNEVMEHLVNALWKVYFRPLFRLVFGLYAGIFSVCCLYTVLLGWEHKGGNHHIRGICLILDGMLLFAGATNLLAELNQLKHDKREYFYDLWNFVHWLFYGLMTSTAVFHVLDMNYITVCCSSFSTVMAAFVLLFYLKGFKNAGGIVRMLEKVVSELFWFVMVLIIFLFSFSAAFYALYDEEVDGYRDYWQVLFTAFKMMIGDFDTDAFDDATNSTLMGFFFIIYMVLMAVVMLNFIITVLSETYAEAKKTSKGDLLFQKAKIILELYYFLRDEDIKEMNALKWVHLIRPSNKVINSAPHPDLNHQKNRFGSNKQLLNEAVCKTEMMLRKMQYTNAFEYTAHMENLMKAMEEMHHNTVKAMKVMLKEHRQKMRKLEDTNLETKNAIKRSGIYCNIP